MAAWLTKQDTANSISMSPNTNGATLPNLAEHHSPYVWLHWRSRSDEAPSLTQSGTISLRDIAKLRAHILTPLRSHVSA